MSETNRRTFTEEEVFNLELKAHNAGAVNGRNAERRRIIALAQGKVCFGHNETGNCDHSVCFGMTELINAIGGENE